MKKVPHCPSQQQFKLDTTINFRRTASPNIKVQMNAPTKPSTVFLGLSLINGVRPKSLPAKNQRDRGS
jgi:hypothetical protein